jgi:glycosyltransferase involved in cell wall biosynthesis
MKVSIIIPVFNEVSTVLELLARVEMAPVGALEKEIVIVESNSTDGTKEKVNQFVQNAPLDLQVKVIFQDRARGKGHAVREGLQEATGDIIMIQDGDLEYDVNDYPSVLEPIVQGRADFVLGSRHLSAGTWKIRRFEKRPLKSFVLNLGGVFFHGIFNLLYGQSLTDPTTMYKVFRRRCVEKLHFEAERFDFDFELVAKLIRAGFIPFEVPVSYNSRGFEEGKKIRVFRDPFTWLRAIIKFRFSPLYEI